MIGNDAQESAALECECQPEEVTLLPCSGGSNCGQIANQVALKLDEEGKGRMYCLAGIGAHITGMVESARGAKRIVALDGCDTACARNAIEHAGLAVTDWVCVTNAGISKNHEFNIVDQEVNLIARRAMESLSRPIEAST